MLSSAGEDSVGTPWSMGSCMESCTQSSSACQKCEGLFIDCSLFSYTHWNSELSEMLMIKNFSLSLETLPILPSGLCLHELLFFSGPGVILIILWTSNIFPFADTVPSV